MYVQEAFTYETNLYWLAESYVQGCNSAMKKVLIVMTVMSQTSLAQFT